MTIYHLMNFIEQGKYTEMKYLEQVTNNINESIRTFQMTTDEKRIEWKDSGVVSKFVPRREYSWDKDALKELFFNLGILIQTCSIGSEQLSHDQLKILNHKKMMRIERYVRFSPNKQLETKEDNERWASLDKPSQLVVWLEHHKKLEKLFSEWKRIRELATFSSLLQREKMAKFDYGTISLLEKKPLYLVEDFVRLFGIYELLNTAVVDISKVEVLAAKGFINMTELRSYREVVDVKLKFYLMEISKEKAMIEFNGKRLKFLSLLSIKRSFECNLINPSSEDLHM